MPRQNAVAYIHDYATLQHCMSACPNLVCGAVSFVFFRSNIWCDHCLLHYLTPKTTARVLYLANDRRLIYKFLKYILFIYKFLKYIL